MGFFNLNFRWHPRLFGSKHVRANVTKHGWRSTSFIFGWLTANPKYRRVTLDWPGPGSISYTFGGRARRTRRRR